MRGGSLFTSPIAALAAVVLMALGLSAWRAGFAADELLWREVDPENLVFVELYEGLVAIELNPVYAPKTTEQFRNLVRQGFYDGLSFYRVIDGFVAQGGDGSDLGELSDLPLIDAEFEREWVEELPFTPVQSPDLFAPETGFSDGFAAARDLSENATWLTHCPGVVAMARNDSPDSSRTDFYIVIGQAPRYLDRNLNVFGRVVSGMEIVQQVRRGRAENNGVIQDETSSTRIRRMRVATDIPEQERMAAFVTDTNAKSFEKLLKNRRDRKQKFFHHRPPEVLDVCQVPVASRLTR
jgi:peptidylprolyl isomerase